MLSKADPALTYDVLEKQFRARGFKIFLIGMVGVRAYLFPTALIKGCRRKKYPTL